MTSTAVAPDGIDLEYSRSELRHAMDNQKAFTAPYFALAVITAALSFDNVDTYQLLVWVAAFFSYTIYRGTVAVVFARKSEAKQNRHEHLWWGLTNASGALHGLLWMAYCFLTFPSASFAVQVLVTALILTLCCIGTMFALGSRLGLMAFIFASISGCALCWLLYGVDYSVNFVVGIIAFGGILERAGNMQAKLIHEKIKLALRNAALVTELQQRNEALNLNNREKSRLIATASHDLRQPTHALGMMTERMNVQMTPLQLGRSIQLIKTRVSILSEMLGGLLDFSKLESGNLKPSAVNVDFNDLVIEVADAFRDETRSKALRLNTYSSELIVRTDPMVTRRILWNLVSNAVKYTKRGSVSIYTEIHDGRPEIIVADTGNGIPADKLQDIFREYYRLDDDRDREEGLGIGLAVVDRAVHLLGAELDVQSELGVGSRFRVRFPVRSASSSTDSIDTAMDTGPALLRPSGGFRILIVEDDEVSRDCTADVISEWGYNVFAAASQTEAMVICHDLATAPHLVICDFHLGVSANGVKCIQSIRREMKKPGLPCILMTGNLENSINKLANDNQIQLSYKPVRPSRLRLAIKTALRSADYV